MAKITLSLDTKKVDLNGKCPLFITFTYNSKRLRLYTSERITEKDWDKKTNKVKRSNTQHKEINDYLEALGDRIKSIYRDFTSKGIIPQPDEIKQMLLPQENILQTASDVISEKPMTALFDDFIQHARMQGTSIERLKHYKTFKRILVTIEEFYTIRLYPSSYDIKTHDKFLNYLVHEAENSPNTITKKVIILKRFLNYYCVEVEKIAINPDVKQMKSKWVEVRKVYLTMSEIEQIQQANLPPNLQRAADCFLFACFTGIRFGDIARLTPSNIEIAEDMRLLRFKQEKTNTDTVIALNEYAWEIVEKYKEQSHIKRGIARLLPIKLNHHMNIEIKEVGRMAGIDSLFETVEYEKGVPKNVLKEKYKLITFHTGRHTYAVESLRRGMNIVVLQKQLGHKSIEITMKYAQIVDIHRHQVSLDIWKKKHE